MELKKQLIKPYTEQERLDFIVKQNHEKGYKIKETETALEAWGYTDEEKTQQQRARLDMLNLTKADVLLALYEDKGITPDNIKEMLKDNVPALIKFDYASSYYRGDEVVNALGLALGYTTEEMDYLFENKTFPPKSVEPVEPADADSDMDLDSDADTDTDVKTDNEESEVTE